MHLQVLKLEKSIANTFQQYDQTERELFTAFSDSIRDSHEKQRAQMEYTKYFGFVLSIAGSFLAFVYSTLRKNQLKQIIDERLLKVTESNIQLMNATVENRRALDTFGDQVVNVLSQLSNYTRKNENFNTVLNDAASSESNTLLNPKNTYLKVAGVLVGLWFISRVLSGWLLLIQVDIWQFRHHEMSNKKKTKKTKKQNKTSRLQRCSRNVDLNEKRAFLKANNFDFVWEYFWGMYQWWFLLYKYIVVIKLWSFNLAGLCCPLMSQSFFIFVYRDLKKLLLGFFNNFIYKKTI